MKTLIKMIKHREIVRKNFNRFISKLQERSDLHDLSKYNQDEFGGFAELDSKEVFRLYETNPEEYRKKIAENEGIRLHYERNSHHPEHYKDGAEGITHIQAIDKMSFLDIVEMVIDWKSACETYGTDFDEAVEKSIKRFQPSQKLEWLIRLIANDVK